MIRATNGPMGEHKEARISIVDSRSPRAVGSRPCPMVLRDHCRNCSDCLIPPYSVHPPASAQGSETTWHLDHVRENQSCQVFSNEADRPAKYDRQQTN